MKYVNIGISESWKIPICDNGILENPNIILDYWNPEKLESWKIGILENSHIPIIQYFNRKYWNTEIQ